MGIPASQRLRKQSDFQEVRKSEHRLHCGPFILQIELGEPASVALPILGVIASRRVGNAVKRNRGKRLVREVFRKNAESLPRGSRCVVVLRSSFDRYDFAALQDQFNKAISKIIHSADTANSES